LDEHGQIIATTASDIGQQIAQDTGTLAVEVHNNLDTFCKDNTGESLAGHQEALVSNCESLTKKFTDLGSEGSSALVLGVVNQFVTAGEQSQKQLTELLEFAAPHLQAHGPAIATALEANCGTLKNVTGNLVSAIPKSPEYLGTVLGTICKTNIISKDHMDKVLGSMKVKTN
jgi:hypothetical protein